MMGMIQDTREESKMNKKLLGIRTMVATGIGAAISLC